MVEGGRMAQWSRRTGAFCAVALALALAGSARAELPTASPPPPEVPIVPQERLLLEGFEAMRLGDSEKAMDTFSALSRDNPDFRLAQLIHADLLLGRTRFLKDFGEGALARKKVNGHVYTVEMLLEETQARLGYAAQRPPPGWLPKELLHLSPQFLSVVVVDLTWSRFYLFQNRDGLPVLTADYYISIAKNGFDKSKEGDKRTPLGLYFITEYYSPEKLDDFYGSGALPLNYPNEWDQLHNRGGSGIWLHGTPYGLYSRPPRSTEGCVALTNPDFLELTQRVNLGAPVVLSKNVHWMAPDAWKTWRAHFAKQMEAWRADWSSRDASRVLRHYSAEFRNSLQDGRSWRGVLPEWLNLSPPAAMREGSLSILGYPGSEEMVVVTFEQDPVGLGPDAWNRRRQYWRQEGDGQWKIIFEDQV
ncbi:MAG: L,D-transpeptidase [Magnetococcales bacterium]|nr:L,D-transpeptidase [Magnetococcales bacterium]